MNLLFHWSLYYLNFQLNRMSPPTHLVLKFLNYLLNQNYRLNPKSQYYQNYL
jgi:hypothetical protein